MHYMLLFLIYCYLSSNVAFAHALLSEDCFICTLLFLINHYLSPKGFRVYIYIANYTLLFLVSHYFNHVVISHIIISCESLFLVNHYLSSKVFRVYIPRHLHIIISCKSLFIAKGFQSIYT